MSIGFQSDKPAIDSRVGGLSLQLRDLFGNVAELQTFLAGKSVDDLVAIGYTNTEATLLKQNWTIVDMFRQVFEGLTPIPNAVDIRPYLAPFIGPN